MFYIEVRFESRSRNVSASHLPSAVFQMLNRRRTVTVSQCHALDITRQFVIARYRHSLRILSFTLMQANEVAELRAFCNCAIRFYFIVGPRSDMSLLCFEWYHATAMV